MTARTLVELEAQLSKVIPITSTEIETAEGDCKGLYVFRGSDGEIWSWSPQPITYSFRHVDTLAEADMIMFSCPACFGTDREHCVMVTFAGRDVPAEAGSRDSTGKPSRWTVAGTGLNDLSLTPSIALNASADVKSNVCRWHGFVGSSGIPPGHAG